MTSEFTKVALDKLDFDPQNPRLPQHLKSAPEHDVLSYLIIECNLIELMMSIGEQDFFEGEPLLVVANPKISDRFIVVEGNRRLGALKLLNSEEEAPATPKAIAQARATSKYQPKDIPCLVFEERDDILTYLGYRHITGIKEWDSLQKARYLKQLKNRHVDSNYTVDQIYKVLAKEIGSKAPYVAKLLCGLDLLELANERGLLHRINKREDDISFSLLTTGIGYENIQSFIGLTSFSDFSTDNISGENFDLFFNWVFNDLKGSTVLGESREFSKLARIVSNEQALTYLKNGCSLSEADLFTEGPLQAVREMLSSIEKILESAQKALSITDGLEQRDLDLSKKIKNLSSNLYGSIGQMLNEDDEF